MIESFIFLEMFKNTFLTYCDQLKTEYREIYFLTFHLIWTYSSSCKIDVTLAVCPQIFLNKKRNRAYFLSR